MLDLILLRGMPAIVAQGLLFFGIIYCIVKIGNYISESREYNRKMKIQQQTQRKIAEQKKAQEEEKKRIEEEKKQKESIHSQLQSPQIINLDGYNCVDLGKEIPFFIATKNLGAPNLLELGDNYVWASTLKNQQQSQNNKVWEYNLNMATAEELKELGFHNNNYKGNPKFDVASYVMSENWETPTNEDFEKLFTYCNWIKINQNGIKGYKIKGSNGNFIFIPEGSYVSSTANVNDDQFIPGFNGMEDSKHALFMLFGCSLTNVPRYFMGQIRPIYSKLNISS